MNSHISSYTDSVRYRSLENLRKDSIDFSLIYCGREKCDPGHRFGPNRRSDYLLHVVLDGRGVLELNNKSYKLKKNDAFLLFPNVSSYYQADRSDPWEYCWVGFNGIMSHETMINAGFTESNPVQSISDSYVASLEAYVDSMLEARQLTFANELKRNSYLMGFFAQLVEHHHGQFPQPEYDYPAAVYVRHAVEYITHNYSGRIRIQELAAYIGVSRSYLTSSFKRVLGLSPQEFLVNLRIEKAASLLKNTEIPINTIALNVGYEDSLAFSKIFKKHSGMSPKIYRSAPPQPTTPDTKKDYSPILEDKEKSLNTESEFGEDMDSEDRPKIYSDTSSNSL